MIGGSSSVAARAALIAMLALATTSGASAQSLLSTRYTAAWSSPAFLPTGQTRFVLGNVLDDTGRPVSFEIAPYLREQLRQRLTKAGFSESGSADAVRIDVSIRLYQEGSTFARWAGGGAAYCVAHAHLRRGAAEAELVVTSVLSGGGLFSVGAEKTVLEDVAHEIAARLSSEAAK